MSIETEAPKRKKPGRPPSTKPTLRLDSLRLDGRTKMARRIGELAALFADALGGADKLTELKLDECGRAAALVVVAEVATERFLAGGSELTLNDVVRAEGAARRAVKALGIRTDAKPQQQSLAEYLASKSAAQ